MSAVKAGCTAYVNARILDPASGFDGPGELLTNGEDIVDTAAVVLAQSANCD